MNKNKRLTLDERTEIQERLAKGMTFKAIAERIGKNQTTVSREGKSAFSIPFERICPYRRNLP